MRPDAGGAPVWPRERRASSLCGRRTTRCATTESRDRLTQIADAPDADAPDDGVHEQFTLTNPGRGGARVCCRSRSAHIRGSPGRWQRQ